MNLQEARTLIPEIAGLDDESALNVIHQAYYPELDRAVIAERLGYVAPPPPAEERTWGEVGKDVGITALKGAISVPEAVVGMGSLVSGGRAGQWAEEAGFRPAEAKAMLDEQYSDEQKAAFAEFRDAEGVGGKFMAAVQNPSVVGHTVLESLPAMGAGGVFARGVVKLAPAVGAMVAGAAGEGAMMAGGAAEQIRQQTEDGRLSGKQAGLAAATGVGGMFFSVLGGKVAQKLGLADVDTMLAGAATDAGMRKGVIRSTLEGAIAEGGLEELPQSVMEQVLQNEALGRPLEEGVDEAAVLGFLSGAVMGGGANAINSVSGPAAPPPPPPGPAERAASMAPLPPEPEAPPPKPVMPDPESAQKLLDHANERARVLQEKEKGTKEQKTTDEAGNEVVTPAKRPEFLTPDEKAEQQLLKERGGDAAALAEVYAEELGIKPPVQQALGTSLTGTDPASLVQPDENALMDGARYIQGEREGERRTEAAMAKMERQAARDQAGMREFDRKPADEEPAIEEVDPGALPFPQAGDILNPKDEPFKTAMAARRAQKAKGGEVLPVLGGWVVRPVAAKPADAGQEQPATDSEWKSFAASTGTLAIPRAEMPQIKSEHRGAMVNFLGARGVTSEQTEVDPSVLKPTQSEFSTKKVEKATKFEGPDRSILISGDGHIVDGHHQWLAKMTAGTAVKVIRLNAPIAELLPLVREFPSSTVDEVSTNVPNQPQASQERPAEAPAIEAQPAQEGAGAVATDPVSPDGNTGPVEAAGVAAPAKKPPYVSKADGERLFGVDVKRQKATERVAKGTAYFGTQQKADDFIKNGRISDTHEVVQAKPGRFEVRSKVATQKQDATPVVDQKPADVGDKSMADLRAEAFAAESNRDGAPSSLDNNLITSLFGYSGAAERWAKARKTGMNDADLKANIGDAFGNMGGGPFANAHTGGEAPKFWHKADGGIASAHGTPTLAGAKLVAEVRRVLGIPQPVATEAPKETALDRRERLVAERTEKKPVTPQVPNEPGTAYVLPSFAANGAKGDAPAADRTVKVPASVDAALTGQVEKTKRRIKRLKGEAEADGMSLDEKKRAQTKVLAAETTLRKMRTTRFEAEDAAIKAIESRDPKAFGEHADVFSDAVEAIEALVAKATPAATEEKPKGIVGRRADGVMIREDENGVRYYTEGGVRLTETVTMRPTRQGMQMSRGELKPDFMTAEELKAEKDAKEERAPAGAPQPDSPAPSKTVAKADLSEQEKAAKAKMLNAAGKLASLLSKNTRASITPEQEQAMLPIVIELFEGAMDLGYVKFKQAARYVREFIANAIDQDAADAIPIDTLQGAYIATARRHKDKDITSKGDVVAVESIEDLIEEAIPATIEPTAETKAPDGPTDTGKQGPQALDEVATPEGGGTEEGGRVRGSRAGRGDRSAPADSGLEEPGVSGSRSGGSGSTSVRAPKPRGRGKSGAVGAAGTGTEGARVSAPDEGLSDLFSQPTEPVSVANIQAIDFKITDDVRLGRGGEVEKFNDNLLAIRTLKAIEAEGRRATSDEQRALARYVGWGGLANAFPAPGTGKFKPAWEARGKELQELLTEKEHALAERSTLDSHYTSQDVVNAMWSAAARLGFKGGLAAETSMGVGNFLGLMPEALRGATRFVGVEYDSLTARIAGLLYPQATVLNAGLQDVPLPDGAFDLNIGNPPFGSQSLRFQYKPEFNRVSIHNQFFLAGIDSLKPGGLQINVVSRYLLDAKDSTTREMLARKAKLLGVIRLPDTAFKENARTEVVTDIVILQRLTEAEESEMGFAFDAKAEKKGVGEAERQRQALLDKIPAWVDTVAIRDPLGGDQMVVNSYIAQNPGMVLGTLERSGSMQYGGDITVRAADGPISEQLAKAIEKLPQGVLNRTDDEITSALARHKSMSDGLRIALSGQETGAIVKSLDGGLEQVIERETPEGDYELAKRPLTAQSPWSEKIMQNADGQWYELSQVMDAEGNPAKQVKVDKITGEEVPTKLNVYERKVFASEAEIPESARLGETRFARLVKMVGLRDLMVAQINLETEDAPSAKMEANRKKLAAAYRDFVATEGFISKPANSTLVANMPDGALVQALEMSYRKAITPAMAKKMGEKVRPESAEPAPILSGRVIPKYEPPTKADTPADALAIVLSEAGRVDLERMGSLLGKTPEELVVELYESADKPMIFKDPESEVWVTRNDYLTGNVKKKLHAAQAAGLSKNVAELEAVMPEPWGPESVTVLLGATWVPPAVYEKFLEHVTGDAARVSFSSLTNSYAVTGAKATKAKQEEWGAEGISISDMVGAMLNSTAIKVMTYDADRKPQIDQERTALAAIKAKQLANEFTDWAFADAERRRLLVDIFNEKFNTRVNRQHDGSHLVLPGKVPDILIKMRRHQKNAIWRGIIERNMLMDHAVGAGKTFTAIARAMERRRMGLSQKPAIIVPNHMVEQFKLDVYRLYPGAKVLAAGKADFERSRRRKLLAKVASGDWDVVIIPHSSFGFIGISEETEGRYLAQELALAEQAILDAWEEAGEAEGSYRKPFNVKQAQRLRDKIVARMDRIKGSGKKDRLLTFEQMGIDDMTVDEAHEFKNLFYSSRLTGVKGMGNPTGSQKAFDLYNKVRVLEETPTGTVTFMTGTPISNSAVEMYTMMRFLVPNELRELGLEHFDAWRAQFVSHDAGWEPNETGRLKEVARLGRSWSNMRSLMDLYYSFTDSVSNDDIKAAYKEDNNGEQFPIPAVKGGERRSVVMQPTAAQDAMLREVVGEFDRLPNIQDPRERNIARLRLMDRARKLSLDIRAAEKSSPSKEEGGKLEVLAKEAHALYKKWDADKGTQLIFLDRSVPKAKGDDKIIKEYDALVAERSKAIGNDDEEAIRRVQDKLDKFDSDEVEQLRSAQAGGWNAYQQIKDNLVALGIPAAEIRFVQEANNDAQKQAMFDSVNDGSTRILIGSTPRMGAGTNVQRRLVALHHADVTWKPSDIEQREGRIIRQGNMLLDKYGIDKFEVEILAYATERTIDAKMWSLNSSKLKTINAIRNYDGAFSMDFEDEDSVNMAEMAALASGNPLLLERVKLGSEIDKLELLERQHKKQQFGIDGRISDAERSMRDAPKLIEASVKRAAQANAGVEALRAHVEARRVTVEGKEYSTFNDAVKAAKASMELQQGGDKKAKFAIKVGERRLTSENGAFEAISEKMGDAEPFLATMGGKEYTARTDLARDIAKAATAASVDFAKGEVKDLPSVEVNGFKVEVVATRSQYGGYYTELALVDADGQTVTTQSARSVSESNIYTTSGFTRPLDDLETYLDPNGFETSGRRAQKRADTAKEEMEGLRAKANKPFAQADELKTKRDRLAEVIKILASEPEKPLAGTEPPAASQESLSITDDGGYTPGDGLQAATQKHQSLVADLAQRINTGLLAGRPPAVLHAVAPRAGEQTRLSRSLAATQTVARRLFGHEVVFLEFEGKPLFNGVASSGIKDTVFIRADAQRPHMAVLGHELLHKLRTTNPGIYANLDNRLTKLLSADGASKYLARLEARYKTQGLELPVNWDEEMWADVVGDSFMDPVFWKAMAADQPGLFRRVVNAILKFLDDVLASATEGKTPFGTKEFITDVKEARDAVAMAMREFGSTQVGAVADPTESPAPIDIMLSIADDTPPPNDPRAMVAKARNVVDDLFNTPGKLNWWHKSVGTQYNLAQRSAPFKKVFDGVQDFLNDVSYHATQAAELAPKILPKLDTWRDIFRSPVTADDNKAISAPIFEGTLAWRRDESGNPVKMSAAEAAAGDMTTEQKSQRLLRGGHVTERMLKMWRGLPIDQYETIIEGKFERDMLAAGIVWTDAEMREIFNLTDTQIELYREFRAATDKSLASLAISDMLRFGGKDTMALRDEAMDSPDANVAAILLRDHLLEMADSDPERRDVLIDTANKMVEKADKVQGLMNRGYAPLSRFGHYSLDVVDSDGERVYFGLFESKAEAGKMARSMRANFPDSVIRQGTMSEESYKLFAGVSPETLELFGGMLGLEADGDGAKDKVFQEYLKLAKGNRSAMKRLIQRKGVAGFSEDAGRVLAGFIYSNARQTASGLHMGQIAEAASEIPNQQGEMKDAALKLMEYIKNPVEEASRFRGLLFAQYLGGSIASAMVNMTQPFAVTVPYLSQFGGVRAASSEMGAAARDLLKKSTGESDLDAALKKAEEDGIVAPQEVHQLMAQAQGRATLKAGDGTTMGDAKAKASNALSKASLAWGKAFGAAEQFNRRLTFIASFRLAKKRGMADPAGFAEKSIAETQFIYNKGNKPRWARGAVGGTLFTFKQYSISYMELLTRMATAGEPGSPERAAGRKAALMAVGILFLMGGAGGVPFIEDVEDIVDGVLQRLGYNFSTKQKRKELLADAFGDEIALFLEQGLSGLPGAPIDVSGRLGMGNLIPGTGLFLQKPDHSRDIVDAAGPAGDLIRRGFQAANALAAGDLAKAATIISPVAMRNVVKAVDMANTGLYRDDRGRKVLDTTAYDSFAKFIGFQPNDVAKVQEGSFAMQKMISLNKMTEADIAGRWAIGVFEKDQAKIADARERMQDWNRKNPESPIRINMAQILRRVQAMRMGKDERIAKTAPREIRAAVQRELSRE